MSLNNKKNKSVLFLVWLMVMIATSAIYQWPYLQQIDDQYNDYWRKQIAANSRPAEDILVIEIDEKSLTEMESQVGRWPWPRSVYGYLVEDLLAVRAKAIVFDITFQERDFYNPDHDDFFAQSVSQRDNIFFPASILDDSFPVDSVSLDNLPDSFFVTKGSPTMPAPRAKMLLPWIIDTSDWNIGLINFLADDDGVARRYPVVRDIQGWKIFSLPKRVVDYVHKLEPVSTKAPSSAQTPETINLKYKGLNKMPFNSLSFVEARQLLQNHQQSELFAEKIVVVGATATGLHDLRQTPIASLYPATSILAMAMDNLLLNDFLRLVDRKIGLALTLSFISLIWLISVYFDSYKIQLVYSCGALLSGAFLVYISSYFLSQSGLLFPALSSMILVALFMTGILFYQGLSEYFSRQHILSTFSRFMDPQIVKQLISDENWQEKIANKSSEISVLFSDIRGFTTLSEKRSAEEIMQILNNYFNLQVEAIFNTRGTLDKFIGDAIMAFWGAPIEDDQHAIHAVDAALKLVDNLLLFRETLPTELQEFDVGIGVHSGTAVVGMLGSNKRFDYTAIGDTVNLASRIEGATKGIARVLVSEVTKDLCGTEFDFEYRGEFSVKGREEKVKLFEPMRR